MTVKKQKTENDLDERFQWHEPLDKDHIFPDELEMITKLRKDILELEHENDKFVACFLIARRHDMAETTTLLKRFFKKKTEYGHMFPGQHFPSFKYNHYLAENLIKGGGALLHPKGKRDKKDRMIRYYHMALDKPKVRELDETYASLFWQTYYIIETEPLNAWRNGVAIVVDLKGASLHNIDISGKGREIHSALQGTFPFRVRAMLVINGNWVVSALLTAAKLALPKKMYERIKLMDESALKDAVPIDQLTPQYGGTSGPFMVHEYIAEIASTEDELFAKGIWKPPVSVDGASP